MITDYSINFFFKNNIDDIDNSIIDSFRKLENNSFILKYNTTLKFKLTDTLTDNLSLELLKMLNLPYK